MKSEQSASQLQEGRAATDNGSLAEVSAHGPFQRWGLYVVGWLLFGLLLAAPLYFQLAPEEKAIPRSRAISELFRWYLWGLLFPLMWWVARRFPLGRRNWPLRLFINVALALAICVLYGFLDLFKQQLIIDVASGQLLLHALRNFPAHLQTTIDLNLVVYFAIFAMIHAFLYYEKFRDRELEASRLEAQLALSKLEVLKMQLHPHFLFNTLNAISALMHRDVDAADRMIALLSNLLRLSLDKDDRHQVPLQSELDFLDHYLEIEKIRFQDRLRVEKDIESECLLAQVPKLILQPLVENAIRHGIAMRSAAGEVRIRGRRRGNRLDLLVSDDGPGLRTSGLREGVGIANTRARLQQLYGEDFRFRLENGRAGGLEVLIEIPFEEEARIPIEGAV